MSPENTLVKLLNRDDERFISADNRWVRSQRGSLLCPQCDCLRSSVYPAPIDVPLRQLPAGTSYSLVSGGGVGVIHASLLAVLEPYLQECVLGRCLAANGAVIEDYRSLYFATTIRERGSGDGTYYICRCGIASAISEAPYVLRESLGDRSVFQSKSRVLYVTESLAGKIPWRRFRDIEPFAIPVLDEPMVDDPYPQVEAARQELNRAFADDWAAAVRAVQEEVADLRLPDGTHRVRTIVRDLRLVVICWVSAGWPRIGSILLA